MSLEVRIATSILGFWVIGKLKVPVKLEDTPTFLEIFTGRSVTIRRGLPSSVVNELLNSTVSPGDPSMYKIPDRHALGAGGSVVTDISLAGQLAEPPPFVTVRLTVYVPAVAGAVQLVGLVVVDEKVPPVLVQEYVNPVPVVLAVRVTTPPGVVEEGDAVIDVHVGAATRATVIALEGQLTVPPLFVTARLTV
jgi:hypothetical protein